MIDRRLLADLLRDASVRSISRRYLVSNGFDGALTSVGIAVGALLSGVPDGRTVLGIGAGAAIGLATSGVWSVWEIERAEKRVDLGRIEEAMLTDLEDTRLARRRRLARAINAAASGLGPIVGVAVPLAPFALEGTVLSMRAAAVAAVAAGSAVLFAFGAYLGSISDQRWYVAGARMGLAGVVVAALNLLVP